MKILRILILLLVFPILTASSSHKFYVSITTIEYAPEQQSLQLISKIFLDDIEDVLEQRYNRKFYFNSKKETKADADLMRKYVLQKLKIKVNGQPVTYNFIGSKYDIDIVQYYVEIPNIETFNSIEVENDLLMDLFEDQQNIIHVKNKDTRKSLILEKQNPKGLLNFEG